MNVNGRLHSLGALTVGALCALTLVSACSSSGNGHPVAAAVSPSAGGTVASASSQTASGQPSSVPALTGGKFCSDFSDANLADLGSASSTSYTKLIQVWTKLADDAPPAIHPDATLVKDFLVSAAAGKPDLSKADGVASAASHIATWTAANCH